MTSLNPCGLCGSPAAEQTRHEHHKHDSADIPENHEKGIPLVEMHDGIRHDIRIACTKCPNAIGWNKRDAPGMPGVGKQFIADLWNKQNPVAAHESRI